MRRTGGRRYRGREEGSLLSAASLLQTARPATVGRIRCGPATGGRSAAGIFCGTCRAGHAGAAGRQGPQQVGARRGARRGRRMGGRCTFSLVVVALRLVDAHLLADVFILLPERVEEVGDPRHPHRAPEHLPAVHLLPDHEPPVTSQRIFQFCFFSFAYFRWRSHTGQSHRSTRQSHRWRLRQPRRSSAPRRWQAWCRSWHSSPSSPSPCTRGRARSRRPPDYQHSTGCQ
jgi:hypothetical protein